MMTLMKFMFAKSCRSYWKINCTSRLRNVSFMQPLSASWATSSLSTRYRWTRLRSVWSTLDSRKKVRQFLGFANFYRKCIRNFSQNFKPDALFCLHDPEPVAKEPETILPLKRVVGAVSWQI